MIRVTHKAVQGSHDERRRDAPHDATRAKKKEARPSRISYYEIKKLNHKPTRT